MKTPIRQIHIPHSLNLRKPDERRFDPPQLGDVYSEGSESMDDLPFLAALMAAAAVVFMAASIVYYLAK